MSIKHMMIGTLVLLITGCFYPSFTITHPEYKKLSEIPKEQRYIEFRKLPIEKQLEIYLVAMSRSHPPNREFADDIAEQRENIIPFLIEKIKEYRNEASLSQISITRKGATQIMRQDILFIFHTMVENHKCDIKITREQLDFILSEIILLKEEIELLFSDYPKNTVQLYKNIPQYYGENIIKLLNCPPVQLNCNP